MFESVYHGVPLVTMPVFCDHDVNAAKAVADGYALRLDLETLTTDKLSEYETNTIALKEWCVKQSAHFVELL